MAYVLQGKLAATQTAGQITTDGNGDTVTDVNVHELLVEIQAGENPVWFAPRSDVASSGASEGHKITPPASGSPIFRTMRPETLGELYFICAAGQTATVYWYADTRRS